MYNTTCHTERYYWGGTLHGLSLYDKKRDMRACGLLWLVFRDAAGTSFVAPVVVLWWTHGCPVFGAKSTHFNFLNYLYHPLVGEDQFCHAFGVETEVRGDPRQREGCCDRKLAGHRELPSDPTEADGWWSQHPYPAWRSIPPDETRKG